MLLNDSTNSDFLVSNLSAGVALEIADRKAATSCDAIALSIAKS